MEYDPLMQSQLVPGQLGAAETLFQSLLASAPDAIVIIDRNGQIVLVNGQTEQMFGYLRSELIDHSVDMLLPERLHAIHARHRAGYVAEPHTRPMGANIDLVAKRKDGSIFPVEISLSPLYTERGLLITSVIRDITERKQAAVVLEQQVERRTAHLNALLQFSQDLLSAGSLDAVLQRALAYAMELVPQAQRGAIYLYMQPEDRLALRASVGFSQLPELGRPTELGIIGDAFTDQRPHIVSSAAELDQLPGGRQRLLRALQLPEAPSGMALIPLLAYEQAIGVLLLLREAGAGPFAAESLATLLGLANLTAAAILAEQRTRETATLTAKLARLEDQQRLMEARLTVAEAAMLQAARLAAVGELAASIAHEINNPLYAARNSLYLHADDLPAELRDSQYLQIAREQLTRIAGIIERMRNFYRPDRGELSPADVNQIIESTLAVAEVHVRHAAIRAVFIPAPDLPAVVCNADQLRQVFLNVILNAIDAMPHGGTLTLRTIAGSSVALIEVQDTGVGIPPDVRARLFEPFFTTKANGTGLGLSISAHIVTQHGGQIEVESTIEQGSTIRIVLPYQQARTANPDRPPI